MIAEQYKVYHRFYLQNYLQNDPMSFFSGQVQTLLSNNFLTLKITTTRTSIHAGILFSKLKKKEQILGFIL